MGKRSNFDRVERDFYPTPREAVIPLIPHLQSISAFCEPCAGDGALIQHLEGMARLRCVEAYDIEPKVMGIKKLDVLAGDLPIGLPFITNPPWDRKILHPLIDRLAGIAPTRLFFDADWMHTKQSAPFMPWLCKIVSVGRVKWIPDSKMTGKDNCAWYLFDKNNSSKTTFYGREA